MRAPRWSAKDGFIREVVWLALIVAVIAVVLLDALALFNTHQSSHDAASSAVRAAETEYAQSSSVAQAKIAARQNLEQSGKELIVFEATGTTEGAMGFQVTAKAHAKTMAFEYLSRVPGLDDWVKNVTNPASTESSE